MRDSPSCAYLLVFMSTTKLKPTHAARRVIGAFAEDVARKLSFGPGDAIQPLIKRLGGQIIVKNPVSYTDRQPESIRVRGANDFTIYVPGMTSLERDRFTIAHELGHLLLHYPLFAKEHSGQEMIATRWVDESDKEQQRAEWEANWFAAAFLMGSQAFRKAYEAANKNVQAVAIEFGVSVAAAEVRVKTLGLA
ncbi:ImmA/IrrE family metallo-endopeptidase [Mesorhizobium sp. Cs1321R2N1]|uniref:ImmA/IrrE family metallo-endopeptidase n=1 Tax=Mesorhizobium sp. Cs1321R2N1 TaxID=3015174 RepID=UPI00301D246B